MPVRRKCHRVLDGDRGEALVHCQMLPDARRQQHNLGRGCGDGGGAEGDVVHCCGRLQRGT